MKNHEFCERAVCRTVDLITTESDYDGPTATIREHLSRQIEFIPMKLAMSCGDVRRLYSMSNATVAAMYFQIVSRLLKRFEGQLDSLLGENGIRESHWRREKAYGKLNRRENARFDDFCDRLGANTRRFHGSVSRQLETGCQEIVSDATLIGDFPPRQIEPVELREFMLADFVRSHEEMLMTWQQGGQTRESGRLAEANFAFRWLWCLKGIYFLKRGEHIIYIGMSQNIGGRFEKYANGQWASKDLRAHMRKSGIVDVAVLLHIMPDDSEQTELELYERQMIDDARDKHAILNVQGLSKAYRGSTTRSGWESS